MAITVEHLIAQVEANPAGAIAALEALSVAVDHAARNRTAHIDVDVDNGAAQARTVLTGIEGALGAVTSAAGGTANAISGASAVLDGFGGSATGAGDAAGKASTQMFSMGGGTGNMVMQVLMAIPQLAMMGVMLWGVYAALTVVGGALAMLTALVVGLVAALAPLVGLLGALPVLLGAAVGGIGSLVLGMGGMMETVKLMDNAEKGLTNSTYDAITAANQLRDARRAIADANKAVSRAEKDLAEATADVAEAQKQAAKDLVQYRRSVRDSLWAEEDAVRALKDAQENLANAQKRAAKSGAILSKETDDFTGKIYEVARVSSDAVDAAEDRADAEYAVEQAQRALTKAQEATAEARERLNEAERKGVQGSDRVQNAIERQVSAQEALVNAHQNVQRATERLAEVQRQQAKAAQGSMSANLALKEAMDKLSPAGKTFVTFLHDEFMPAIDSLKRSAQEGLLPGVQKGLEDLLRVMPDINNEVYLFSKGMGEAFAEIMAHLTSKEMVKDLKELGKLFRDVLFGDDKKKTKGLMDAIIPLIDIVIALTKAAGPMVKMMTDDFVGALNDIAKWMKKPENAKKMEDFFMNSYKFLKLWGGVLKPLVGIFDSIVRAAAPLAEWMLTSMAEWLTKIDADLKTPEGFKKLQDFFEGMKPAIEVTIGAIGDLFKAMFPPGVKGEDTPFVVMMKSVRQDLIPALSDLFKTLTEDKDSAKSFIQLMAGFVRALDWMVQNRDGIEDLVIFGLNPFAGAVNLVGEALGVSSTDMATAVVDWGRSADKFKTETIPKWTAALGAFASMFGGLIGLVSPGWSSFTTWMGRKISEFLKLFSITGNFQTTLTIMLGQMFQGLYEKFATAVNRVLDVYNWLTTFIPVLKPVTYRMPTSLSNTPSGQLPGSEHERRAFGGPVEGGQSYIVGEKRPEVLTMPEGSRGNIAAAVPRPMQSTAPGITEEQLERLLQKVLEKAKPNVDMTVNQSEHADPTQISREIAWAIR